MKNILLVKFIALGDLIQLIIALNYHMSKSKNNDRFYLVADESYIHFLQALSPNVNFVGVNSKNFYGNNIFLFFFEFLKISIKLFFYFPFFSKVIFFNNNWRYKALFIFTKIKINEEGKNIYDHETILRNRIYNFYCKLSGNEFFMLDLKKAINQTRKIINKSNKFISNQMNIFDSCCRYIVLNPGGCKNNLREDNLRRWPIDNYKNLAIKLINHGFKVILVGDSNDKWVLSKFVDLNILDMIGKINLFQTLSLINQASAFVSHDTGLLHLSSISDCKKIVSIFGPTNSSAVLNKIDSSIVILKPNSKLTCSPCYNGFNYAECTNALCMKSTSVEKVYDMLLASD